MALLLLVYIVGFVDSIKESEWVAVAFLFFMSCIRLAEIIVAYLMYGAVHTNDWKKLILLMKWEF